MQGLVFAMGSCTDSCCAGMQFQIKRAMEVSHPGEWHCRHLLLTKGTLMYAKSAGKLGLILNYNDIELNGRELYERTMTVRA